MKDEELFYPEIIFCFNVDKVLLGFILLRETNDLPIKGNCLTDSERELSRESKCSLTLFDEIISSRISGWFLNLY